MRRHLIVNFGLAVSLSLCLLISGCCFGIVDLFRVEYQRTEKLFVPAVDIEVLDVLTNVGSITVTGADVNVCSVTADIIVKAGSEEKARELADQVEINAEASGGRLCLRYTRPAGLGRRPLTVAYTIEVPERLRLECRSQVGEIRISQVRGAIEASTNVGTVDCEDVVADIELRTNVGDIRVDYDSSAPAGVNAGITTNVGDIRFVGPPELSAAISASTNVGSISTEKPISVVGKVGKSLNGVLGSGEGDIKLKTNVGSIKIR